MAQDLEALHRIAGRNEALRVKANLDDGEAKARLAVLTRDRKVHVKVDVDQSKLGLLNRMIDRLGGGIPSGVDVPFAGNVSLPAIAAITGAVAGLLPELAGVASGFAAAGAGALAFYALAHPAIKNLEGDVKNLSAAHSKLQLAQNAYAADPSKTNLKALIKAQDQLKAVNEAIAQDSGPAAAGMMKLRTEYDKLSKSFQGQAFDVLSKGLKVATDLLPKATPFAQTFATTIGGLLRQLDKGVNSQGFAKFLSQLRQIEGPAINSIGQGIGKVAASFGRLITVMSGKDVAHALNIAFGAAAGIIDGVTYAVRNLMQGWDQASAGAVKAGHEIATAFDYVRHLFASIGSSLGRGAADFTVGYFNAIKSGVSKVIGFLSGVGGKIKAVFSGAGGWLVSQGAALIGGFLRGAKADWNATNAWLNSIAGKVKGALAGAGSWLVSAGKAIIQGLINGIESAIPGLKGVLHTISGLIPSWKGPLDYDRVMLYPNGQAIMQGLMGGIRSQVPALENQLRGITGTIHDAGANAAGGGGGVNHIHIHLDGREIYSAVQARSVSTQRRTGHTGLGKRTR